jgi:hypothetical protein
MQCGGHVAQASIRLGATSIERQFGSVDTRNAAQANITPFSGSCDTITLAGNKVGVSKGTLAAAIVGSIVGVLVLVAIIGTIVWCCCCQLRR